MEQSIKTEKKRKNQVLQGITKITVSGYKSISRKHTIEIAPLTILAGANSSGKSSMMQPLLLLKQTLELGYDPGALLIDGDNVKFTSIHQLLSRTSDKSDEPFSLELEINKKSSCGLKYVVVPELGLVSEEMSLKEGKTRVNLRYGMKQKDIEKIIARDLEKSLFGKKTSYEIFRERCFLGIAIIRKEGDEHMRVAPPLSFLLRRRISDSDEFENEIRRIIHLPGLRGNPERVYPRSATGPNFPSTFENYTASVIAEWQSKKMEKKIHALWSDLKELGLTWKVSAEKIDDTRVSLQVGRLCTPADDSTDNDLVDISDVGFGTSQTLPILVALHVAVPGQLVFIEQPETHLHPRAQYRMASILVNAAKRGVRVVVETHSALLLLGIQAKVAKKELNRKLVKLHWFKRGPDGCTEISSAALDKSGAFGDWPEDFSEVQFDAQDEYLDAG